MMVACWAQCITHWAAHGTHSYAALVQDLTQSSSPYDYSVTGQPSSWKKPWDGTG